MRRCLLCTFLLLCGFGFRPTAFAQSKSQVETDIDEARRDAEARRSQQAFDSKRNADNAAAAERRSADAAELRRLRETAPAREAAARAEREERRAELKADDDYLNNIAAESMLYAHVTAKREELEKLKNHPPVPLVPGSYTECDELASAPFDNTRPLGLTGVTRGDMKTGAAIASCREELEKHPESARTAFELARALVYAGRCDEGIPALKDAIAKGSAAAAVSYALLPLGGCKTQAGPVDEEKYFKLASDMGSGDGAWLLGKHYGDMSKGMEISSPESRALFKLETAAYQRAYKLVDERAMKGDLDALYIEADMGHMGSFIMGYDSIHSQYRCVVRGYAPCKRFDQTGGR